MHLCYIVFIEIAIIMDMLTTFRDAVVKCYIVFNYHCLPYREEADEVSGQNYPTSLLCCRQWYLDDCGYCA